LLKRTELAECPEMGKNYYYAVTLHKNDAIYATGGVVNNRSSTQTFSFDLDSESWREGPPLNVARRLHSSCCTGLKTFVLCGSGNNGYLNSVEFLDLTVARESEKYKWTLLELAQTSFNPRSSPLVCGISSSNILLMGGDRRDAHVIDVAAATSREVKKDCGGLNFRCYS